MFDFIFTAETDMGINQIGTIAEFINRFGFMIVFAAVMLLVLIFVLYNAQKNAMRKSEVELELMKRERTSSIEHNAKMFDLVTEVQTKQIVQLDSMTVALQNISFTISENKTGLEEVTNKLNDLQEKISAQDDKQEVIIDMLQQLIDFASKNEKFEAEISEKINHIDDQMINSNGLCKSVKKDEKEEIK